MKKLEYCSVKRTFFMLILPIFFLLSCERFVEADPPETQLVDVTAFENDESATAILTGVYSRMMGSIGFAGGYFGMTFLGGLSADELVSYRTPNAFFENTLLPTEVVIELYFWNEVYQYIYTANSVVEGLQEEKGTSTPVRKQLLGEAKFIRAFCYFYLVNFFGDVPLHLTSDYRVNMNRPRTPRDEVYKQIIIDLKEAQQLLSADYYFSEGERTRPNAWVATALLARTYLYIHDWDNAEIEATKVINQSHIYNLQTDINEVFLKDSHEAIWQLKPVQNAINTWDGFRFIPVSTPPVTEGLNKRVIDAFETGDYREEHWTGSVSDGETTWYYPFKYKIRLGSILTEYVMVLRLAEQYLIRAEARVQLNKIRKAIADIDIIRKRAGLNLIADINPGISQSGLLEVILHERQVELFAEWGHRWLDLKRMELVDSVLGQYKSNWDATDALYPIPLKEIERNSEIIQNPGY